MSQPAVIATEDFCLKLRSEGWMERGGFSDVRVLISKRRSQVVGPHSFGFEGEFTLYGVINTQ
jgi:hypothetical protein